MPSSRSSRPPTRRDSWPPTQMHLHRSIEDEDTPMDMGHDPDLSFIDEDPLHYFLTPAPLLDDGDTDDEDIDMEMEMDFGAGIEDANNPVPIIRSVSPSSLDGGLTPPPRSPPSRNSPEVTTPGSNADDEDDGEEYVRFSPSLAIPGKFGLPISLRDFTSNSLSKSKRAAKDERERMAKSIAADALLSPSSFRVGRPPSARGRPMARPNLAPRPNSWSGSGRPARSSVRAWRQPSPDVWSIQEETEEDLMSELDLNADPKSVKTVKPKNKKKVRFALDVREEIP